MLTPRIEAYHPKAGDYGVLAWEGNTPPYLGTLPPNLGAAELPYRLSETRAFASTRLLKPATDLVPYRVAVELWSDAALKTRWVAVPSGTTITYREETEWSFPSGTVFVKHFDIVTNEMTGAKRRLETRFLVRDQTAAGVYGVTYRWNADESDAVLIDANGADETVRILGANGSFRTQSWRYPSRAQCLECHTPVAGGVLGVKTRQLNCDFLYPDSGVQDNQLRTWMGLGLLHTNVPDYRLSILPKLSALNDTSVPKVERLRSYLDANCAHCHRAGGPNQSFFANYDVPLDEQYILNYLLQPKDTNSSLLQRLTVAGPGQMPPLARNILHSEFIDFLRDLISDPPRVDWVAAQSNSVTLHFDRPMNENYVVSRGFYKIAGHTLDLPYLDHARQTVGFLVDPPLTNANEYVEVGAVADGGQPFEFSWPGVRFTLRPGVVPHNHFTNALDLGSNLHASGPFIFTEKASAEPGEPSIGGRTPLRTVWHKWTAPVSGPVAVDTFDSANPTTIGVFTGNSLGTLVPVANASTPADADYARLTFNATAGTTYRIVADGVSARLGVAEVRVRVQVLNDSFARAWTFSRAGTMSFGNVDFTKEPGEPNHAGNAGGHSAWFTWVAPFDCAAEVTTFDRNVPGSYYDTLLAVYTGNAVNNLTPVAANDDNAGQTYSLTTFTAMAGQRYYFVVDGKDGDYDEYGKLTLTLYQPATPILVSPPQGEWIYAGVPNLLRALLTLGDSHVTNVHYLVNGMLVGTDDTLTNGVTWVPPAPGSYAVMVVALDDAGARGRTTRTVNAIANTLRPTNDSWTSATLLNGTTPRLAGNNTYASTLPNEPAHANNRGGHSLWYRWVPAQNGTAYFRASSTNFDTLIALYDENVLLFGQKDDATFGTLDGGLYFPAFAGATYLIAVDGYNSQAGDFALDIHYLNDSAANAWSLPAGGDCIFGDTAGTSDGLWFSWTPAVEAPFDISTAGSAIGTRLDIYAGTPGHLTLVTNNATFPLGDSRSRLTLWPTLGQHYYIRITSFSGAMGGVALKLTVMPPPRIASLMLFSQPPNPLAFLQVYGAEAVDGVLESTANFQTWTPVTTNALFGFQSETPYSDYGITNAPPHRFYRVRYQK
jgi:mono/diheme cytochrome c family protein